MQQALQYRLRPQRRLTRFCPQERLRPRAEEAAKIGLGIGAATVFTLILLGGLYLCFRKRTLEPNPANNSRLLGNGSQVNTSFHSAEKSQTLVYGQSHGNYAAIFEAPENSKPNIFEAPAGDYRQVFEAPLNEKKQIFELQ